MKNIIGAVNWFKGKTPPTRGLKESHEEWLVLLCNQSIDEWSAGCMYQGRTEFNERYFEQVCTFDEFNDEVTSLSHFKGEALFNEYLAADKAELEPIKEKQVDYTSEEFWKDAPEGATHYKVSLSLGGESCWYKAIKDEKAVMSSGGAWRYTGWDSSDVIKNNVGGYEVSFVPRPQPVKPVYTKETAGNGEFKSGQKVFIAQMNTLAGVESQRYCIKQYWCDSDHHKQYAELGIIFSNKEDAEIKCKSLLGIDTRTSKEKAVDALRDLDDSICNDIKWHENFLQAIIDGKVPGVTFKGEE